MAKPLNTRREIALDKAVRIAIANGETDPDVTTARADKFDDFLKGKKTKPVAEGPAKEKATSFLK